MTSETYIELKQWYATHAHVFSASSSLSFDMYSNINEFGRMRVVEEDIGALMGREAVRKGLIAFSTKPDGEHGVIQINGRCVLLKEDMPNDLKTEIEDLKEANDALKKRMEMLERVVKQERACGICAYDEEAAGGAHCGPCVRRESNEWTLVLKGGAK